MDCSSSFCESLPPGVPPNLHLESARRRTFCFRLTDSNPTPLLVKLIEKNESLIDSFSLVIKKIILYFA